MKWREGLEVFVMANTQKRRPSSVVSVEGAIGAIGARTGGEGSSRMQFDDSYKWDRTIRGSRARFAMSWGR